MVAADGTIHQPICVQPFDGSTAAYRDLRTSTTDMSYTYQVTTELNDQSDMAEIVIEKTSGEGRIDVEGDMFTWYATSGANVTATVTVTHNETTETYTLTAQLIGRAV